MHRAVLVRRPVLATTAALLALSLAACGEGGAAESALDSRAQWTQVSMPESSQVAGPRVSFAAALGRSGDLPSLVAGAGGDPGEPASARAFTEAGEDGWRWKELPLPEDSESGVGFAVSDGTTTWIGGTTWQAGEPVTPYVVSSADRTTWKVIDLPDGAVDSALRPGAAAVADGALLIVGMDGEDQPVALHLGDDAGLLPLPAAPDGREFRGFTGIAVAGATVVAVGRAAAPGRTDESVVYRSKDGGATWSADMSLAGGPSEPAGVAVSGNAFVVTGRFWAEDGVSHAAAWSSADGAVWVSEQLPTLDWDRDGLAVREGDDHRLGGPAVGADGRMVAPFLVDVRLGSAVVQRDTAGVWTVLGGAPDWEFPGAGAEGAVNDDGSVLLAQSGRNVGRLGLVSAEGRWSGRTTTFGTHDYGVQFSEFLDPDGSPVLTGQLPVVETTGRGGWTQTSRLSSYAVDGHTLVDRPWDPAESAELSDMAAASRDDGASVLLGAQVMQGEDGAKANVVGWFRPAAGAPWTPVEGFATPRTEWVNDVAWVDGTWIAVGGGRASFSTTDLHTATVWTSADGVNWTAAQGPFGSGAAGGQTEANGTCVLTGGDLLVVGESNENAQDRPVAWRFTGEQWQQVAAGTFAAEFGSFSSCTNQGDTTLVQGTSSGRATLWRSTDGVNFEATTLGERGESFGTIRVIDGGYAAAGTRSSKGLQGAVVWLSEDAERWRAVPVPSARVLSGADVMPDGSGGLVVATTSSASPEVWTLANPGELFEAD